MILALLKLMRVYYSLPLAGGFIVILSYLTGGKISPIFDKTIFSFISLFSIISAGYVLNDVCDIDIDKINCPSRVLAAGKLQRKTAIIGVTILLVVGLAFTALCNLPFLLVILAITGLLIFYDLFSGEKRAKGGHV